MTGTIDLTTGRRRRARQAFAFAALCAALVGVIAVSSAGARDAKVLGKTKRTPSPDCPTDTSRRPCEGVGSVTGFPLVAGGEKRPMNVPRNGKLVAWAIDLSRPNKSQREFFGELFKSERYGVKPTARISVIKHRRKRDYKLLRQSPVVRLSSALGRRQVFTLDKPLRVKKGQVVALTVPTWSSNFASHISERRNKWRASRSRRNCEPNSSDITAVRRFARKSRPQQKVGSVRGYGCDYTSARLLYWAYYVGR
jgi:hypothetical protein